MSKPRDLYIGGFRFGDDEPVDQYCTVTLMDRRGHLHVREVLPDDKDSVRITRQQLRLAIRGCGQARIEGAIHVDAEELEFELFGSET